MFHAMVYKLANGLSKLDVHGFMGKILSTTQIGHPETYLSCDQNRPKMALQEYCSGRSMHPQLRLYELFLSTTQIGHPGAHLSRDQNRPKTALQEYCSGSSMHPQLLKAGGKLST